MLEEMKARVCAANLRLVEEGLVFHTWGNVSEIDRKAGLVVIKPSGIDYAKMKPEDMVVVDLATGGVIEGKYQPSSDTPTHLEIYRNFQEIGGITHTHSMNAVAFAQAGLDIPALGTTHADYFFGDVPCTRGLTKKEVEEAYEKNTGKVIVEELEKRRIQPMQIPGVIVRNHGPFCWGKDSTESVFISVVLERVAEICLKTLLLNQCASMPKYILKKHYSRKHGKNAYYGQRKKPSDE